MAEIKPIGREEIVTVLPQDAIKAILTPEEVSVDEAAAEMAPDEMIIAVTIGSDSRAYPIHILSAHEIVNDVVGGKPVAVTW